MKHELESIGATRTNGRYAILALVTVCTMLNFLDRSVLSVAAPAIRTDMGIGAATMGVLFSAFSWTYALSQVPGGYILDRFKTRLTYAVSLVSWSLCTLLQGLVTSFSMLLTLRLALGVAEAPCFPANSRILSLWFPQKERARATGVYSVGQYSGLAFLSPLLFWVMAVAGWRALLIGVGAIGVLIGLIWYALYREPKQSKWANNEEIQYIADGGGVAESQQSPPFSFRNILLLLSKRQILGASLGQFASNSTQVFFLTWFPTYLSTERHMAWLQVGFMTSLPYIAAACGVLSGGFLSDYLLRRTGSANIARKLPVIMGLSLASVIMTASFISDNRLMIVVMSVAFFGQGICNLGWTLLADVAPKALFGLTAGVFNFFAAIAGIVTPMAVGFIVAATGSFAWALAFIGTLAILGIFCYLFVVGDVKRVEITGVA